MHKHFWAMLFLFIWLLEQQNNQIWTSNSHVYTQEQIWWHIPSFEISSQLETWLPSNMSLLKYGKEHPSSSSLELPWPLSVLSLRLQEGGRLMLSLDPDEEVLLLRWVMALIIPFLMPETSTVSNSLRDKWSSWSVVQCRKRNHTESHDTWVPIKISTERRGNTGKRKELSGIETGAVRLLKLRFRKETDGVCWRILEICQGQIRKKGLHKYVKFVEYFVLNLLIQILQMDVCIFACAIFDVLKIKYMGREHILNLKILMYFFVSLCLVTTLWYNLYSKRES